MSYKKSKTETFAALSAGLITMTTGLNAGFGTVSISQLNLNEDLASWFASIEFFTAIPVAPLGGLVAGWLGRKTAVLIFSPFTTIGWLLIGASSSNVDLFLGRILLSLGCSIMMAIPSKQIKLQLKYEFLIER